MIEQRVAGESPRTDDGGGVCGGDQQPRLELLTELVRQRPLVEAVHHARLHVLDGWGRVGQGLDDVEYLLDAHLEQRVVDRDIDPAAEQSAPTRAWSTASFVAHLSRETSASTTHLLAHPRVQHTRVALECRAARLPQPALRSVPQRGCQEGLDHESIVLLQCRQAGGLPRILQREHSRSA